MRRYDTEEARARLPRLIEEALRGEEVVISRSGRAVVRMVPAGEVGAPRRLGTATGKVRVAPDFNAPLADFEDYG